MSGLVHFFINTFDYVTAFKTVHIRKANRNKSPAISSLKY